jgi:predicted ATPase
MSVTPMDEPESALSPQRQLDLLGLLDRINQSAVSQVIRATHSPILMAVPGARVL